MGVKISALSTAVLGDISFDDVLAIVDLVGPTTLRVSLDVLRQSLFPGTSYTAVALGGVTSVTYTTKSISTTALATPSALVATTSEVFASTVSGATLMGYGTTGDVTLKNRAGTDVLVVTANTLNVTMAGALAMAGALSGVTTLAASGSIAANGGVVIAASQALTGTVANSTISGFLSVAATTGTFTNVGGTVTTVTQNSVTTMTGLTTIGTLVAGAVPASLVTAGTFGAGTYTFPGALAITGALTGVTTLTSTGLLAVTVASGYAGTFMGGNVGIGTTGPGAKLSVLDAAGTTTNSLYVESVAQTSGNTGFFYSNSAQSGNTLRVYQDGAGSTGPALYVYSDGAYGAVFEKGNVGIGTTGPSHLLDVNGTFRAVGAATFSSTLAVTGGFGCNGTAPQTAYASGGLLAGVVAALVANGILSN